MKTLKKALSIVLALALMLSCVAGMQVSVSAEGEEATTPALVLSANNPQYDLAKEVDLEPEKVGLVGVSVRVNANAGFAALGYEVTYDDALALNFVVKDGNITDYPITEENQAASSEKLTDKPYKMQWAFVENQTASEFTLAYLQFKLPEDVAAGTNYNVTFTVKEAWDEAGNAVAVTESFTSTISVVDTTPVEPEGPVVDPALVFYRTSLAYGNSSLEFNFRIANTVLDLYNNVEVVIVPQKYDMATLNLVENPAEIVVAKADLAAAGSKYKQYTYTDIQLYELGLNIDYMLRAYDADGNLVAVSETFSTSTATFLKTMSNDTTQAAGFRTLMVDTLVVCDEVMKNVAKSYPESDLAADLAAGKVLEGADLTLATPELGECNTVDNFISYDSEYLQTTATHQIRSSVAIGKVPYINFRVKDQKNALDLNKLEVNVKYTSKDKNGDHPYDKTFSGADLTDGTFINCVFAEIGFHDSDKDILFTVSYDGAKKCEWTYSIETYLSGKTTDATIGAQSIALIKLGQSFRSYQGL